MVMGSVCPSHALLECRSLTEISGNLQRQCGHIPKPSSSVESPYSRNFIRRKCLVLQNKVTFRATSCKAMPVPSLPLRSGKELFKFRGLSEGPCLVQQWQGAAGGLMMTAGKSMCQCQPLFPSQTFHSVNTLPQLLILEFLSNHTGSHLLS